MKDRKAIGEFRGIVTQFDEPSSQVAYSTSGAYQAVRGLFVWWYMDLWFELTGELEGESEGGISPVGADLFWSMDALNKRGAG